MTTNNRVAILDAGGQYVDLVKKAVERQAVAADILPLNTALYKIEKKYKAIIISGSPASSHAESAPSVDKAVWQSSLPLLGICYGMQSMVVAGGGQVAKNAIREDASIITNIDNSHPLFKGIKGELKALFTHGDFVIKLPKSFKVLGQHDLSNGATAYSAITRGNKLGVQFHPEVFDDTPEGYQIIKNYLEFAGLKQDKQFLNNRLDYLIKLKRQQIRKQVGSRPVIAFVSGGVDSSVAIALATPVVPVKNLHAYYIDHGFMRDEDDQVIEMLEAAGIKVNKIDASQEFEQAQITIKGTTYGPLIDTIDPEHKRQIIGKAFIEVQNRLIKQLKLSDALLLQGTNAADRIESGHSTGDSHTATIKTHHNQVKEVKQLKASGRLIEPIDDLFKDEVRELGRYLGLPEELVARQPFPGPGLAIRILATKHNRLTLKTNKNELKIQQFVAQINADTVANLLPLSSVGVGGDERSFLSVASLFNPSLSPAKLEKLATDLPAHFRGLINRVIYALTPINMPHISQTKTLLTSEVRAQLRMADRIVYEAMREFNVINKISQFPVVLVPLSFNGKNQRSIVLRPVKTTTFMTVQAMLPERDLDPLFLKLVSERIVANVPNISAVFLDLTNKPPATTEWE